MKIPRSKRTFVIFAKKTGEKICNITLTNNEYKDLSVVAKEQGVTISDLLLKIIKSEVDAQ
jgi:hypothetical protein